MESRRGTLGTQPQRREAARKKLLEAAIALIGENGLRGFSLQDVGDRAGVSRGLAGYHFQTSKALLTAAVETLLKPETATTEWGLPQLAAWLEVQLARASSREPQLLAALQVAIGPGAQDVLNLRAAWWMRECDFIEKHLARAQTLQQVRPDLDASETARTLLGLLQGEQLRIIALGETQSMLTELLARALAPVARPKGNQKRAPGGEASLDLFSR